MWKSSKKKYRIPADVKFWLKTLLFRFNKRNILILDFITVSSMDNHCCVVDFLKCFFSHIEYWKLVIFGNGSVLRKNLLIGRKTWINAASRGVVCQIVALSFDCYSFVFGLISHFISFDWLSADWIAQKFWLWKNRLTKLFTHEHIFFFLPFFWKRKCSQIRRMFDKQTE